MGIARIEKWKEENNILEQEEEEEARMDMESIATMPFRAFRFKHLVT